MRILATLAFALALAAGSAYANVQFINDDFETGMADARSKKLPLLVYFHTTWCSWCVEMEDKVFTDDEVSDKSNFFVPVRLNCDRRAGQAIADRYQVTSYPTVLVLTTEGKVLGRLAMFRPVPEFLRFLDQCLTPGETLSEIDARIAGGHGSPALLLKSAEQHYEAHEKDLALKRFQAAIAADPDGKAGVAEPGRLGLARLRAANDEDAEALELYRAVLVSTHDNARMSEAFVGTLDILRKQNQGEEIDRLFAQYGARFPDDPAVLNDWAARLVEAGRETDTAVARAKRAVSLSPAIAGYNATLARALVAAGDPAAALDAADKAVDLAPTDRDLRVLRLEILEKVRRPAAGTPKP